MRALPHVAGDCPDQQARYHVAQRPQRYPRNRWNHHTSQAPEINIDRERYTGRRIRSIYVGLCIDGSIPRDPSQKDQQGRDEGEDEGCCSQTCALPGRRHRSGANGRHRLTLRRRGDGSLLPRSLRNARPGSLTTRRRGALTPLRRHRSRTRRPQRCAALRAELGAIIDLGAARRTTHGNPFPWDNGCPHRSAPDAEPLLINRLSAKQKRSRERPKRKRSHRTPSHPIPCERPKRKKPPTLPKRTIRRRAAPRTSAWEASGASSGA